MDEREKNDPIYSFLCGWKRRIWELMVLSLQRT